MPGEVNRRKFIQWSFLWALGVSLAGCGLSPPWGREVDYGEEEREENERKKDEESREREDATVPQLDDHPLPRRYLGKTGLTVSLLGLGGAFLVAQEERQQEAEEFIHHAIDLGINYLDTAPTYGYSENNLGRVMGDRRREVVLASKSEERSYDGVMRDFQGSLERLQTDYLDLYQLHGVHSEASLREVADKAGALKALEELKSNGDISFTGITGHKHASLLGKALREYNFDAVLMTVNCADVHDDSLIAEVLPQATQRKMGVIGMKVVSYGRLLEEEGGAVPIKTALDYALTHPVSSVVVGMDSISQLEENVKIAKEFTPLSPQKMEEIEELAYPYQEQANFFKREW